MSCRCCPPEFPRGECPSNLRPNRTYSCLTATHDWSVSINTGGFLSGTYILTRNIAANTKQGVLLTQNILDSVGAVKCLGGTIPICPDPLGSFPQYIGTLPGGEGEMTCQHPINIIGCYVLASSPAPGNTYPAYCKNGIHSGFQATITLGCNNSFQPGLIGFTNAINVGFNIFGSIASKTSPTVISAAAMNISCGYQAFVPSTYSFSTLTLFKIQRASLIHLQQANILSGTAGPAIKIMTQDITTAYADANGFPDTIEIERL